MLDENYSTGCYKRIGMKTTRVPGTFNILSKDKNLRLSANLDYVSPPPMIVSPLERKMKTMVESIRNQQTNCFRIQVYRLCSSFCSLFSSR